MSTLSLANQREFEDILDRACQSLTRIAQTRPFATAGEFERRVRKELQPVVHDRWGIAIDLDPPDQAFPDIAAGPFGVEVKLTQADSWRTVANSVQETSRVNTVRKIYLVFGKMGGVPEVRWSDYGASVVHVRTSHVPRFEVDVTATRSLFDGLGITYEAFRKLSMEQKMRYIRTYARSRLKKGERLWWLEDSPDPEHTLPIQARLYTTLDKQEKNRVRAEAALLCPQIVQGSAARHKYDDAVLFLLTYHGILTHQARDLFSAGSVANPHNDDQGGRYIERALKLLEKEMLAAAQRLPDALFVEYWGESVPPHQRIKRWLEKADGYAHGWTPSSSLFVGSNA